MDARVFLGSSQEGHVLSNRLNVDIGHFDSLVVSNLEGLVDNLGRSFDGQALVG